MDNRLIEIPKEHDTVEKKMKYLEQLAAEHSVRDNFDMSMAHRLFLTKQHLEREFKYGTPKNTENMKFNEEFRREHPETIGETDKLFDMSNYKDWLEQKLKELREQSLALSDIRNKLSPVKNLIAIITDRTTVKIDKYISKEIEQCKKSIEYLSGKTPSNDDKPFGFESLPPYGYDVDKHVIYNESTDKDICMYFDDETRDMLLDLLNSSVKI